MTKTLIRAMILAALAAAGGITPPSSAQSAAPAKAVPMPLKHFVYIIQENITFDHYFGTYPGANGIPKGVKFAYRPGGPPEIAPFHLTQTHIPHDLNHSWQAAHVSADGGKMDGFLWGEWPQALAFYWKGTLPQPDPEDIMPVSGTLAQASGTRGGGVRRRASAPAAPSPSSTPTTTADWTPRNWPHCWRPCPARIRTRRPC